VSATGAAGADARQGSLAARAFHPGHGLGDPGSAGQPAPGAPVTDNTLAAQSGVAGAGATTGSGAAAGVTAGAAASGTGAGATGASVPLNDVNPAVARMASRGDGTHAMTLRLHPADLGEVRLTVVVRGDTVDVRIAAGAQAREALQQGSAQLRSLLELSGHTTGQVVLRDLAGTGPAVTLVAAQAQQGSHSSQPGHQQGQQPGHQQGQQQGHGPSGQELSGFDLGQRGPDDQPGSSRERAGDPSSGRAAAVAPRGRDGSPLDPTAPDPTGRSSQRRTTSFDVRI
jgi:hypothetical protein